MGKAKLVSTNPGGNYEVLGVVDVSTHAEIRQKVQQAKAAQEGWGSLGVKKRIELLRTVVEEFSKRREELALLATREMGMPIAQSRSDVDDAIRYFTWDLDHGERYLSPEVTYEDEHVIHTVYHEPFGVAAVIIPWNFPASNFVWGAGQHLVVGNTVVLKYSKQCPLFGKLIEEIVRKSDFPEGVFSEVYGDSKVGDYLAHQDIDIISFTGSTKVGQYLYKVASENFIKILLELGGSAPGIVFEDANLDSVLETIYLGRFLNCGQMCDALKRLIVHRERFAEVVEKLKQVLASKKVGDPEDASCDIGSLVSKAQLELLEAQVQDALSKGAHVVIGGGRPKDLKGAYFEPTILTNVTPKMRVWREEVFGPVLPVVSFTTEEEAILFANDTNYGLGAYLFTEDHEKALRVASRVDTGMVGVNNASYLQPSSPFGGYKASGIGREHGIFGFRELTQTKVVAVEKYGSNLKIQS